MKLLWLDCETTGLDPLKNQILELSVGVADLSTPFELESMGHFSLRFELAGIGTDNGPCSACEFDTVARAMHAESGLLAECAGSSTTMGQVEDFLLTLVHGQPERGDDRATLAGSTVHFDLRFLRVHAPRFAARISHRCYDVSAVKLFCESLGMPRIPKGNAHRATADVQESIAHARQCAEWLKASRMMATPEDGLRVPCTLDNCGHMRQLDAIVDLLGMERGTRSVLDELRSRMSDDACSRSTDTPPPIWNVTFEPAPTDDAPCVHILYEGFALCAFSMEVPGRWPANHRWVSYQATDVLDTATCSTCKGALGRFRHQPKGG